MSIKQSVINQFQAVAKEQNQKLLDQQTASLQKLDDVLKDAQQLRTFAHRS